MFSSATRVLLLASFILASPRSMAGGEAAPHESRPAARPLKVHPANPRYFTDGSGKAVYLTGSHTWYSLQDSGPKGKPATPFDYPRYLDLLVARGHDFMRLWAHEGGENESFYEPLPYLRSGPGQALDGKPKFDVSKFDPAYFDRMRSRIVAARDRGIYVGVMLFQGWSLYNHGHGNPWPIHPFNRENNVNGIDGDPDRDGEGKEVQTLAIPAITRLQQAYLRKVIDTVGDLDNVLYEITNESPMQSKEWQYHMIRAIHGYEATKPKRHPVGMTFFDSGGAGAMEALLASPADWISPGNSGSADYFKDPPAADGRKVILNDTDHHASTSSEASWPWRCFFRGQNPICMDWYDGDRWEPIRRAMGETRRLAERVDLAAMSPHGELASTAYCLATPGKEYLVYLPEGGTVEVDLSEATGDLAEEWIETATGKQFPAARAPGGSRRKCTAPFPGEAVLHLSPLAAAPRDMTVYGRAPVGAFGVDTLEHVEGAAKLGMTLIYSYSPESARKQLDLGDPMGQAVSKHKMQVTRGPMRTACTPGSSSIKSSSSMPRVATCWGSGCTSKTAMSERATAATSAPSTSRMGTSGRRSGKPRRGTGSRAPGSSGAPDPMRSSGTTAPTTASRSSAASTTSAPPPGAPCRVRFTISHPTEPRR